MISLDLDRIIKAAATAHGTTIEEMRGPWTDRNIMAARRQVARELKAHPLKLRTTQIAWILNRHPRNVECYFDESFRQRMRVAKAVRRAKQRRGNPPSSIEVAA